jgi:2-C-methyl-D-erythritol 4-phosphate cytidylyltransferase
MGQSALPKQYLPLADRTVIEWSVAPFIAHAACAGVIVVIAADDVQWNSVPLSRDSRVRAVGGGQERADSVLAGVAALRDQCSEQDWILVHDAARPCLDHADLERLIGELCDDAVGGLLAAPLVDTLKRAGDDGRVATTVSREKLWRALTPQMFRYGVLSRALEQSSQRRVLVTDEAQAVELLDLRPKLVAGSADNFKITIPEDLARAALILGQRKMS